MPVSKKRKKDGKVVHRKAQGGATGGAGEEHGHGPEAKAAPQLRQGKPTNPFVAQQQSRKAAQRGR
jgi:hypothetical protein